MCATKWQNKNFKPFVIYCVIYAFILEQRACILAIVVFIAFKAQWFLYVLPELTLKNLYFAHKVHS